MTKKLKDIERQLDINEQFEIHKINKSYKQIHIKGNIIMTEYTSQDAVNAMDADEGNAVKDSISSVLMTKVADALEVKKTEISRGWLNNPLGDTDDS